MPGAATAYAHDFSLAIGYVAPGAHIAFHAAPRPPVTWPHQVGVVPRQADCFQDRATAHQLEQMVDSGGTGVLGQVLVGLGGVGKTQLAAHHARALWQSGQLDLLVWVTAATRAAVVTGYARAAVDVLGADYADPDSAALAFLAWLEPKTGSAQRRWLVVLDDLADPADLRDLWPPASPHGHTVITTRRREAALTGQRRRLVQVGLFTVGEAAAYLTTALSAHGRHEPADHLAGLADDLGYLPLALSQAAAYMIDVDLDCAAYRNLLNDRAHALTEVLPDPSGLPDAQSTTVAAAWSLSLDRADQLPPAGLARPMLEFATMLDPNGIPAPVLTSPPALAHLAKHRTTTPGQAHSEEVTAPDATRALRALHRLSLADHTPDSPQHAVRVHQLLQRAVRDGLISRDRDRTARAAADALVAAWPDIESDTALAEALRANTDALTLNAEDALYQPDAHPVLFRIAHSFSRGGHVAAAIDHFRHLADTCRQRLGPDHEGTRAARYNLAQCQGEAGDATGAADAFADLLVDQQRVLGTDHPATLATRNNLAFWRGEAGDAAGAVAAFADLLADQERVLGPDHPYLLGARDNLAHFQGVMGDATGAADAYADLLVGRERILGSDDPDTLATRNNLAYWRGMAGDAAGAVAAFADLLADQERVLGPDHPNTLGTRNNLAHWRGEAGDAAGAASAYAELLEHALRVLGPDHPATLTARNNCASWRGEAGDSAGSVAALEQLVTDQQRVLGVDHFDTLTTLGNLAYRRGVAGDAAGAASAYAELLEHALRVLGPDHPATLTTQASLAQWQREARDSASAADTYTDLLDRTRRLLGPDHPDTLATRNNLAHSRGEAGDMAGAVTAFEQLLPDLERVLGTDHPATLATRNNLAHWRGEAGDAAGAARAFADLLVNQERVLGADHPAILATRNNLAYSWGMAGDMAGAVTAFEQLLPDLERVLGSDHPDTLAARNNLAHWRGDAVDED